MRKNWGIMTEVGALRALDLFAGTGWGVACQRLGIDEMGVEIMPEAVATREANGMHTLYRDVWDGLQNPVVMAAFYKWCAAGRSVGEFYDMLIASPPCQTFSMAGNGKGRAALNEVIEAIEIGAYKDAAALKSFGEKHDMRTALVLTPLAHVWRDMPRLVVLEQVPTVLPVWEACAEVMRSWGYDVKTAVLNAEQYGVPQTRKRAILVANLSGPANLPTPTHSRYYSRTPDKLDPGVKKWVSMAEALGWTKPGVTFTQNNRQAHQAHRAMDQPAPTVTAGHDSGNRGFIDGDNFTVATPDEVAVLQSYPMAATKHQTEGRAAKYGPRPDRPADAPAFTVVGHDGHPRGGFEWLNVDGTKRRLTTEELGALQTYPTGLRSNYGTGGDSSKRGERTIDQPAPTLTSKADRNKWIFRNGNQANAAKRVADQPAPTIAFGHNSGRVEWVDGDLATKVTVEEAGVLQTYDKPFVWCGAKTKQFLQIGNAVPPLLAEAILSALTSAEWDADALVAEELVSA